MIGFPPVPGNFSKIYCKDGHEHFSSQIGNYLNVMENIFWHQ